MNDRIPCLFNSGEIYIKLGVENGNFPTPGFNILAWKIIWTEEPTLHGVAKSLTQLSY